MFARAATSGFAALVFALGVVSSARSGAFPAQHTWSAVASAPTTDMTKSPPPVEDQHSSESEPFGLATTIVPAGPFVTMWEIMENRISADREALTRCREAAERCSAAAQSFLAIVAEGREHTDRARIGVINRAINLTIHPANLNYWTAPLETFAIGRGNCKQYAIAKYLALIEAGISENDVKLVIVADLATAENHALLAVRLNSDWIMLDNRWLSMVRDTEMRGVIPLFVLDHDGVKQFLPLS